MPCVRWPPWARSSPSTVSPGSMAVRYTAMLAWLPECGCTLACSAAEKLLGPIAGQVFDHVDILAAAVVAPAGIALGIFVGQHAADGLHDRRAGVVFAGDHFQAVGLPLDFAGNGGPNVGVFLFDPIHRSYRGWRLAIATLADSIGLHCRTRGVVRQPRAWLACWAVHRRLGGRRGRRNEKAGRSISLAPHPPRPELGTKATRCASHPLPMGEGLLALRAGRRCRLVRRANR